MLWTTKEGLQNQLSPTKNLPKTSRTPHLQFQLLCIYVCKQTLKTRKSHSEHSWKKWVNWSKFFFQKSKHNSETWLNEINQFFETQFIETSFIKSWLPLLGTKSFSNKKTFFKQKKLFRTKKPFSNNRSIVTSWAEISKKVGHVIQSCFDQPCFFQSIRSFPNVGTRKSFFSKCN